MPFCGQCGSGIASADRFCRSCGIPTPNQNEVPQALARTRSLQDDEPGAASIDLKPRTSGSQRRPVSSAEPSPRESKAVRRDASALNDQRAAGFRREPVRGWLLFLCVALVVIGPAGNLLAMLGSLEADTTKGEIMVQSSLYLALAGWSIAAGVRLWKVRPRAVQHALVFLGVNFAVAFIGAIAAYLLADTSHDAAATASDVGRTAIFTLVWVSYLRHSKRVKATFQDAPLLAAA